MTTQRALSTPTAILISGALIAMAVFFGLRSRPSQDSPQNPAASRPSIAPAALPPQPGEIAPPRAPSQPAQASPDLVAAQLTKALEAQRKTIVERCWAPSFAKQPTPATTKIFVNASFDANGQQVIRGIREDRDTGRADVRQCVSEILAPLQIPPSGANAFAEVELTLP
ncbi:MAG: hypothetical protein HUU21_29470 [Polyangiaceae bacterium]|nr:hypothetical protein [Polyangiaceae bacterium]NUQ77686.1 hypothetical protein [Polyangiaceae bacterium]